MAIRPQHIRSRGRPPAAVAARLPGLLLDAAEALFLARGYGATALEDIAFEAGATKRTIYAKFGDKAGLFSAMARRVVTRHRAWLAEDPAGQTLEERLVEFSTRLLAVALAPDVLALHRLLVAEAHRFPELAALVDALALGGAKSRLGSLLAAAAAQGALALADPAAAAEFLVGMLVNAPTGAGLLGRRHRAAGNLAQWVAPAVSIFLDGCRPRRGSRSGRQQVAEKSSQGLRDLPLGLDPPGPEAPDPRYGQQLQQPAPRPVRLRGVRRHRRSRQPQAPAGALSP